VTAFLPATLLTGTASGLSFASFSAAVDGAAAGALRHRLAISSCFRQLGAVLGISVLIAIVGARPGWPTSTALLADGGDRCDAG
jgi:hypothetical protein